MAPNPTPANPLKQYLIPAVIALVLLALGGYFLMGLLSDDNSGTATTSPDTTAAGNSSGAVSEGSSDASESTDLEKLITEAKAAYQKEQYVDPQGANAVELYLRVLELDPNNRVAQEALLEVMPYATDRADQYISERNIPQAERALALLKKADPNSVILTSLAGKIEQIKRIQASMEADAFALQQAQQQQAQQQAQTQAPAVSPATTEPEPVAETTTTRTPATTTRPATTATPPPTVASAAPTPSVAARTAAESRNFQLVRKVEPSYPQRALRQRIEGWVELSFTVGANGDVSNVQVVDSQPRREFDREAVRALSQWKFRARLENGKAVSATARQRLEFKLGN